MSEYQDLCEMYGTDAGDPDFMDWFLNHLDAKDVVETTNEDKIVNGLPAGRVVHMVKLTATHPAKPLAALFNYIIPRKVTFTKANTLTIKTLDEPAGWFVEHGFIVRSMKEKGCWYQLAYKNTDNETTLKKDLVEEYCVFAGLTAK